MTSYRPLFDEPRRLVIVDAHAHAHRAFHALDAMHAPDGFPTNALYGFMGLVRRIVMDDRPDYFVVVFDAPDERRVTFRSALYPEYKAHRAPRAPDLAKQIPMLRDIARAFSAPILEDDGFEADDLIASVVAVAERAEVKTLVQSADKDLLQLASARTTLWDAMRGRHYQPRAVEEKLGVPPAAVADYLALVGDTSDNVPGVPGIGPKTAAALLRAWGSLDGIYDALETLPPRERNKLEAHRELAYLSRSLTRLRADVPLPFSDLGALALRSPDLSAVTRLCERYGFRDLTPDPRRAPAPSPSPAPAPAPADRPLVTIRDRQQWAQALAAIERSPLVGIALGDKALGLATLGGDAYEIALDLPTSAQRSLFEPAGLATSDVFGALAPVLAAPGRAVIAADALAVSRKVALGRVDFDAAIARRLLGSIATSDETPGVVARIALKERTALAERIERAGLARALTAELALVPIIGALEARGLPLDRSAIERAKKKVDALKRELEQQIHALAGRPFRIDDPKALGEILFGVLGLPALKRGKSQRASLDAMALGELARAHPLPRAVLELQRLQRLDKDCLALLTGERLETRYATHGPSGRVLAVGALSAWHEACGELATLREVLAPIVPSESFLTIDLAQLDLRVAAHLSDDHALIEACIDHDPHRRLAAEMFARPADEVGADERLIAKHLALGLLYGSSAGHIASRSALAIAEVRALVDARRARHDRLLAWQTLLVEEARQRGHVVSLLGRKKPLPELADERPAVKKLAEGLAVSTTITSSAADLVNLFVARSGARIVALLGDRIVVESTDADLGARVDQTLGDLARDLALRVPLRATLTPGILP